jgi:hypothetical protein
MGAVPKSETFLVPKKKENETGKKQYLGLCYDQICLNLRICLESELKFTYLQKSHNKCQTLLRGKSYYPGNY